MRPRLPHDYRLWFVLAALGIVTFGIHARAGQQKVEFRGGIPVAPSGLAGHKLPAQPVEVDTGEGQRIRVSAVTRALEYPWALAFLPDVTMLITERAGRLRVIRNGALHPQFAQNRLVYLSYTKPLDDKKTTVAVARGRFDGKALTEVKDVLVLDR